MTLDFANLFVTAGVQGLVGLAVWAAFQRSIERRDRRMEQLERDLEEVRDQRVAHIVARLDGDEFVRVQQCALTHEQIRERLLEGSEEFREMRDDIVIIKTINARLESNQKLIMGRMQLEWKP
jgi:hypothetical protein